MAKSTDAAYRLPPDLCDAVDAAARQDGRSRTNMLERIVREWMAARQDAPSDLPAAARGAPTPDVRVPAVKRLAVPSAPPQELRDIAAGRIIAQAVSKMAQLRALREGKV